MKVERQIKEEMKEEIKEEIKRRKEKKEEQKKQDEKTTKVNKFIDWVNKGETDIINELFKKHLKFQRPSYMLKLLYTTKDKTENNKLVNAINSGLEDLKKEISKMSKDEKKKMKSQIR